MISIGRSDHVPFRQEPGTGPVRTRASAAASSPLTRVVGGLYGHLPTAAPPDARPEDVGYACRLFACIALLLHSNS